MVGVRCAVVVILMAGGTHGGSRRVIRTLVATAAIADLMAER